ncbi:hypothetical protein NMD75_04505 [Edwardsiella tarda]
MIQDQVIGAPYRIREAQAVLSLWLESVKPSDGDPESHLIGSILTLLGGLPEELEEIHIVLEEAGK